MKNGSIPGYLLSFVRDPWTKSLIYQYQPLCFSHFVRGTVRGRTARADLCPVETDPFHRLSRDGLGAYADNRLESGFLKSAATHQ